MTNWGTCVQCISDTPCSSSQYCTSGNTCASDLGLNAECTRDAMCQSSHCVYHAYSSTGKVCRSGDWASVCQSSSDCNSPLVCGLISPPGPSGYCLECVTDSDCASNEFCEDEMSGCRAYSDVGGVCMEDRWCLSGLTCENYRCAAPASSCSSINCGGCGVNNCGDSTSPDCEWKTATNTCELSTGGSYEVLSVSSECS